ncbi:MAG: hypothetical protein IPK16_14350 [Anaerolineales bacterium]|nr:hypothetical protein [Anaerolineales bacterium]
MLFDPTTRQVDAPGAVTRPEDQAPVTGRLEQIAYGLAGQHTGIVKTGGQLRLLDYLPVIETLLSKVNTQFAHPLEDDPKTVFAAEWVLDNFYLLDQTRQEIEGDLPPTYYRQLPKLTDPGPNHGYPRVYVLARTFAIDEECQFDGRRFARFVTAYQQSHSLTMGELWALPIMLRFVLLASVAQAAGRVAGISSNREKAAGGADAALEFTHVINDNEVVSHSISSLRLINTHEWNDFFEDVSQVQKILCTDPAGIYARMDFATRDRYRGAIEAISRTSGENELAVAQTALALARQAYQDYCDRNSQPETEPSNFEEYANGGGPLHGPSAPEVDLLEANRHLPRASHIGMYLVAEGREQLEKLVGCRPPLGMRLRRWVLKHPTGVYLGSISLVVSMTVALSVAYAASPGASWWLVGLAGILALIPPVALAVDVVNWVVTPPSAACVAKIGFQDGHSSGLPDDGRRARSDRASV